MALYEVSVPIAGEVWARVDADSEEDAVEKVMGVSYTLEVTPHLEESPVVDFYVEDLNQYRALVEGNCFYGPRGEACAELKDRPDDSEE